MTTLAIGSAFIGLALGTRFRFLILLPLAFAGSMFLVVVSIALDQPFPQLLSTVVVFTFLLQFGYICAALLKHVVVPALATRRWSSIRSPKLR